MLSKLLMAIIELKIHIFFILNFKKLSFSEKHLNSFSYFLAFIDCFIIVCWLYFEKFFEKTIFSDSLVSTAHFSDNIWYGFHGLYFQVIHLSFDS